MGEKIDTGKLTTLTVGCLDYWAFAFCALVSLRTVRDATLIANNNGICKMLFELRERGIIDLDIAMSKSEKGLHSEDVENWLEMAKSMGADIEEDKYEKGYLKINKVTRVYISELLVEELCFADEERRGWIFRMAEALEAGKTLEYLEETKRGLLKKTCAPDVNKPYLAVLIPLACISQTQGFYGPIVGTEITKHRNLCRFCRESLKEHDLLEQTA